MTVLIDIKTTAKILNISESTVRKYICETGKHARKFPGTLYVRIGRRVMFNSERLEDWVLAGAKMYELPTVPDASKF